MSRAQKLALWANVRLKYLAKMKSGKGITSDEIKDEGPFPVYGGNGIRGFSKNYTHSGSHVLIGRQGALCGNVHLANGSFWASEHAVVASPENCHQPRWLAYVLSSLNLNQYSVSAAQPGLAVDRIRELTVRVPDAPVQNAIAAFLDRKTQAIDALIRKKERLIELLQEKRQALITRAVTKGLDPSVPMKDSGVEWLGEIPAHWEVHPIKRLARKGAKTFVDGDWIESPFIMDRASGIRVGSCELRI